jgi:bacterioferritin-associated ferredoxin
MIVCICHRVSDRDIERVALQGCTRFEDLQDELRVGTSCGVCRDCARQTFEAQQAAASQRVAWTPARGRAAAPSVAVEATTVPVLG